MENCTQVNIPTTDNSELVCKEYINEACVIINEANPFIGTVAGTPLATFLSKLIDKMKNQQRQINELRTQLNTQNNE